MKSYTSRLVVIPNYGNRLRLNSSSNSSYSFQWERFRSTLIVLPNTNTKRFIQGIELRCGSFADDPIFLSSQYLPPLSPVGTPSDVFSGDESICEYDLRRKTAPRIAESYFDVRRRLLAKSHLLAYNAKDDTDADDNDSFSSMGQSHYHSIYWTDCAWIFNLVFFLSSMPWQKTNFNKLARVIFTGFDIRWVCIFYSADPRN